MLDVSFCPTSSACAEVMTWTAEGDVKVVFFRREPVTTTSAGFSDGGVVSPARARVVVTDRPIIMVVVNRCLNRVIVNAHYNLIRPSSTVDYGSAVSNF